MKNYKELTLLNSENRFLEIKEFVTTDIKKESFLELVKTALLGVQNDEIMAINETAIISELCAKGFLSFDESECLIALASRFPRRFKALQNNQ